MVYWTQVMRRILLLIFWQFGLLAGGRLFADVVTPKDGRQISGLVESGNTQELHIKVGDQSLTLDIHQVQAIQFGVSPTAPAAAAAQGDTLILKDGTHVTGRWWSIDASDVHLLVNNQLQHYPRPDVSAVTFGGATLPPPPPPSSTPAPATSAQPPRRLSQPEEIGVVYFWNGRDLTPLERNQAVERRSGSTQYWEMPAPQSRVRLSEASRLVFIVRLLKGVDPASYSLFLLVTVNGSRRTRPQQGRRGGLVTWPVDIEVNNDSSLITYTLTVRDLPTGEYSFSPSSSNDGYCFGVDPSPPGQ
jgi:hypothetical protein